MRFKVRRGSRIRLFNTESPLVAFCTGYGQLRGCPPWRPRAAYSSFMPLR